MDIKIINAVTTVNAAYKRKETDSYQSVAESIRAAEIAVKTANTATAQAVFAECKTVEDFARRAKIKLVKLNLERKTDTFSAVEADTLLNLSDFAAYKSKSESINLLPDGWRLQVVKSMAELAGMVAKMTDEIDTASELNRIADHYHIAAPRGAKREAKKLLQDFVNAVMPGYAISGADLTKIMLAVFRVNPLTWRVALPKEDTMLKVLSALLYSMVTRADSDDLFESVASAD